MGLFVLGWEIGAFIITIKGKGTLEWVTFVALALVSVFVVASISYREARFGRLGATTLVVLSVFLGALEFARAWQTSDVRAAAVIRENKKAVIGFYVAETTDRVYIARLTFEGDTFNPAKSRLVAFSKAQITDFAVGPPVEPNTALEQAKTLAGELCGMQLRPPPPTVTQKPTPCWGKKLPGE
jgi:hypothetical protein